jgi:hypothetical protein
VDLDSTPTMQIKKKLTEVLSRYLPGGTEENHEHLRISGVSAEIRVKNFTAELTGLVHIKANSSKMTCFRLHVFILKNVILHQANEKVIKAIYQTELLGFRILSVVRILNNVFLLII